MQPKIITLLTTFAGFGIVAACSVAGQSGSGEQPAPASPQRTSATYTLSAGQSVALTPTASLKLERVNDSRCKTGAVCVWEGYISYSFVLTNNGNSSSFVLSEKCRAQPIPSPSRVCASPSPAWNRPSRLR